MLTTVLRMAGCGDFSRMSPALKASSNKTHFMITSAMRVTLHENLLYSKEDVREMSPNFAAEIIKNGRKRAENVADEDIANWRKHFEEYDSLPPS